MRRCALLLFTGVVAFAQQTGIEGIWLGTLSAGPAKLRLLLKVSKDAGGALSATLDSIDQGASNLPVSTISIEDGKLKFEMKQIRASFEGTMKGEEIDGQWTQGASMPLVFKKTDKPPVNERPQHPKKPYPYDEEEVTYSNKSAEGVTLAGTLTIPRAAGRHPAVLLISGSGPQDRDESIMGHKPFLVLADHLTRNGIAVLRYDDRGYGKSTGRFATATSVDFASDARAGVEFLKSHARIDPARIGVAGHSEGGLVGPMAAAGSRDVAFVVLMAGTGVTGEEVMYEQGALIYRSMGMPETRIARVRKQQQEMFAVLKTETDPAAIATKLRTVVDKTWAAMTEEDKKTSGGEAAAEASIKMYATPWFRYFITYDPTPTLAKLKQPVLAINGELDLQAPPGQNLPAIVKALEAGGNRDYAAIKLGGLNHLFQTSKTGAVSEYAQIEETIAPAALETISEWILRRTAKK